MGSLRPQSSLPSLHDAATSASSSRTLDRFAVPAIPRWDELRSDGNGRSASPEFPPSYPAQSLHRPLSRTNERLTPPAPAYRTASDLSMGESTMDFHGRSRAELEALYRQQQMTSELERARMRDRALRSEQMHMEHPVSSRPSPRASSPRKLPQHKVYLINCKHCDLFLTDRGMKAVLLLKPNITLYSTDSIPTNCSPLYPPSPFLTGNSHHGPPVERTCDCLTQTLGCHGCGAPIGYNIVAPCARCTSSVAKHQRGSNG
jgi:FAM72 protein